MTQCYRLINGTHMVSDGNGTRTLRPGAILESEVDLVAQFPNKFQKVGDEPYLTLPQGKSKQEIWDPLGDLGLQQ